MIYQIFDIFFVVFHSILIIFNITGWIWKRARFINLITLIITGLSWLLLGIIVGTMGYCPLTDWHFKVLYRLGEKDLPDSYIKYLFDRITGQDIDATLVNNVTLYVFIIVLMISVILNLRDFRHKKKAKQTRRPEDQKTRRPEDLLCYISAHLPRTNDAGITFPHNISAL